MGYYANDNIQTLMCNMGNPSIPCTYKYDHPRGTEIFPHETHFLSITTYSPLHLYVSSLQLHTVTVIGCVWLSVFLCVHVRPLAVGQLWLIQLYFLCNETCHMLLALQDWRGEWRPLVHHVCGALAEQQRLSTEECVLAEPLAWVTLTLLHSGHSVFLSRAKALIYAWKVQNKTFCGACFSEPSAYNPTVSRLSAWSCQRMNTRHNPIQKLQHSSSHDKYLLF